MKQATLCLLVNRNSENGLIKQVCLAMKKRGFGVNKWNGVGGKLKEGETIEEAMVRETWEEIGVSVKNYQKVAILNFYFQQESTWNQQVHVYIGEEWEGEPSESEEMNPKWFFPEEFPYLEMWPDDQFWMPRIFAGKKVRGNFRFANGDEMIDHEIQEVDQFFDE